MDSIVVIISPMQSVVEIISQWCRILLAPWGYYFYNRHHWGYFYYWLHGDIIYTIGSMGILFLLLTPLGIFFLLLTFRDLEAKISRLFYVMWLSFNQ
jgi:hypothetical protein